MLEKIWTEKYRPKSLNEIAGQKNAASRLEAFVNKKSLPHCLFAGPAGVGKTTAAICIARGFFGSQWHGNFLELNASDERGIDTIRVKVKDFARTVPIGGGFKIIYLDEADALTKDAQHALRRTMEKYSDTARFILSCNYSSKIIEPIQSRTAVFRFSALDKESVKTQLKDISRKENIKINDDALDAIVYIAEGDLRKAINTLQAVAISGENITREDVYLATNSADPDAVKNMLSAAISGDFKQSKGILVVLINEKGMSGIDIIKEIHNQIFSLPVDDKKKIALMEKTGECEFRITEGSNARIQLESLLALMALAGIP